VPDVAVVIGSPGRKTIGAGRAIGIEARHGVYAWVTGPGYETPAETRCLRVAGTDLVGMSTAPETIVARHMGIDVLAVSCVTKTAAGMQTGVLDHRTCWPRPSGPAISSPHSSRR
jgi:purine-nucleoside phosphorylase